MIKIALALLVAAQLLQAKSITMLLNRLEKMPQSQLDRLSVEKSKLGERALSDKLMPKVDISAGYEVYSSPNGMLPVAPNELIGMVKDQSVGQPFSRQIMREGVSFSWPLFVKSIYTLKEKAQLLHLAAKEKKRLNLLQRQAIVVGSVAQLRYLEAMSQALQTKKRSILETQKSTKVKTESGRIPESANYLLQSHIDDLDIAMNGIEQNRNLLASKIETLTGIDLKHSVALHLKREVRQGEILALKPLATKVEATQKGIKAAEESYYPTVATKGNYGYSQADAYNNGASLHEHFGSVSLR